MVQYLSQVYEKSASAIPAPLAEDYTSPISTDTVTATGLTRAHRNMARSMTSAPASTVTAATTTQVSDASSTVVVEGNGSSANTYTSTSTSSTSPSSSAAGPKATQNGGTVLDQAGSTGGASSILRAGSSWGVSMSVGLMGFLAWLW